MSGVEGGSEHDFPIVWVAWEGDGWSTPWPLEDVKLIELHPAALTQDEYRATLEEQR